MAKTPGWCLLLWHFLPGNNIRPESKRNNNMDDNNKSNNINNNDNNNSNNNSNTNNSHINSNNIKKATSLFGYKRHLGLTLYIFHILYDIVTI